MRSILPAAHVKTALFSCIGMLPIVVSGFILAPQFGNDNDVKSRSMKIDIIREMKLLAMVLIFPVAALAVTVEPLPLSEFADTEVSTNISFVVDRSMMTRIQFTVELDATPTNNVEVAIGTDGNGDGNLSVEEAAYVFGYDCGKWFARSAGLEGLEGLGSLEGLGGGRVEKTFVLKRRQLDTAWDTVKVTRRGCGAVCELVKAEGRKPGFKLEVR